jgi:hypothetical protein
MKFEGNASEDHEALYRSDPFASRVNLGGGSEDEIFGRCSSATAGLRCAWYAAKTYIMI